MDKVQAVVSLRSGRLSGKYNMGDVVIMRKCLLSEGMFTLPFITLQNMLESWLTYQRCGGHHIYWEDLFICFPRSVCSKIPTLHLCFFLCFPQLVKSLSQDTMGGNACLTSLLIFFKWSVCSMTLKESVDSFFLFFVLLGISSASIRGKWLQGPRWFTPTSQRAMSLCVAVLLCVVCIHQGEFTRIHS